jgi:hypothetical protein
MPMRWRRVSVFHGRDDRAPLYRAAARFVTQGRDCQALGVPIFSREAAFLLDAMAALPRKWVSGGAPTLPFDTRARCHAGLAAAFL